MKTYYFEFNGIWPVGACGYVVAETPEYALALANIAIGEVMGELITLEALIEVDTHLPHAKIILNGNY